MAVRWLVLLGITGCIRDDLVVCGDGRACGVGLVCDQIHLTCVMQDQLDACRGVADLTPCTGSVTGLCFDGVCLAPGCGNRVIEDGEQCDDGEHAAGDGCSIDCSSNEQCGNGVRDGSLGEACDDGNLMSHDGCDSRCGLERVQWRAHPAALPGISPFTATFDEARGRLVLADATTWEWDGSAWEVRSIASPTAFWRAAVYDRDRSRIVAFGTLFSGGIVAADWDGLAWTVLATAGTAPDNIMAAAYEGPNQILVMYAGLSGPEFTLLHTDTLTWDAGKPLPFATPANPMLAFDGRGVVALVGGAATWFWDGAVWTSRAGTPAEQESVTMTFDGMRQQIVAVGGTTGTLSTWNGSTWTDTSIRIGPRILPGLWYDPASGALGIVGGTNQSGLATPHLLELAGTTLTDRSPVLPTGAGPIVYDMIRRRMLAFDMFSSTEAWSWSETGTWQKLAGPALPSAIGVLAFDPVRGGVLMLDQTGKTYLLTDAWWSQLQLPDSGVPYGGAITYDYTRRRMISLDAQGTWALPSDGSAWTQVALSVGGASSAGYDSGRANPVMITTSHTNVGLFDLVDGTHWVPSLAPGITYVVASSLHTRSVIMIDGANGGGDGRPVWERRGDEFLIYDAIPTPDFQIIGSPTEALNGRVIVPARAGNSSFLLERQLVGTLRDESCGDDQDLDTDGLAGCADPDCWMICGPACPLATTCP
jgi:cysteine-rich repeat protein